LPSSDDPYGILEARLTVDLQPYTAVNCILVEEIINQVGGFVAIDLYKGFLR
jgi:hypothetical protein